MNSVHPDFQRPKGFVTNLMPWLVGIAALGLYLLTLNRWLTLNSLPLLGQIAGWDWPQNNLGPLLFLATYPFRWLPAGIQPLALNLFSAVCGALTVLLLARSVALLPHDRTQAQRERELSEHSLLTIPLKWLPPLLAVLVCGLQLSFWENATSATGQMLDLLCLAATIGCLLEFRLDGRDAWLFLGTLVISADASNYWLALGLLPAFILAVLWVKGVAFFNLRFLMRLAAAGLAGLSLYLLMPFIQIAAPGAPVTGYWDALHNALEGQKIFFMALLQISPWILALTSLLPLLLLGVRWKSSFGDTSPLGIALASFTFHVVHGVFLLVCWWVAFDPPFGPRNYPHQYGYTMPLLPLCYLSALCVGYFSGYFLLVFGRKSHNRPDNSPLALLVTAAVALMLVFSPVVLIWKNLPQIRLANDRTLPAFAAALAKNLPQPGALVLADDWQTLSLVAAELQRHGHPQSQVLLNTAYLQQYPAYHRFLARRYPSGWTDELARTNQPGTTIPATDLVALLERGAQKEQLYYLHPSFGYYFERFYPVSRGLTYQLNSYPTNTALPPALTAGDLAANQAFWAGQAPVIADLSSRVASNQLADHSIFGPRLLHLTREPDWAATWVGQKYSRALDNWGVILQQNGRLAEAAQAFQQAQALYPDNISAQISLAYNKVLQSGTNTPLELSKPLQEGLAKYKNGPQVLALDGPLDEPQFCYQQAAMFSQGGLFREAAQQFDRVQKLMPDNLGASFALAQCYNTLRLPDEALKVIRAARAITRTNATPNNSVETEFVNLQASAYMIKNEPKKAELVIQTALAAMPDDPDLLNAVLRTYLTYQQYSNALPIVQHQLQLNPDAPLTLVNLGFIHLQLQQYSNAIPAFDRALTLEPTNTVALFDRAVASLQAGQLDGAQRDYEMLASLQPDSYQIYYGLGEIAYRKKDTTNAIANYELYLTNAPANTAEYTNVATRLKQLQAKSP
jgi:tetratricopeptide (TPR) repeat protein